MEVWEYSAHLTSILGSDYFTNKNTVVFREIKVQHSTKNHNNTTKLYNLYNTRETESNMFSFRNHTIYSHLSDSIQRIYQLKSFFPLSRRLIRIFRPVLVLNLAKNPCRRFWTSREGRYVARFPASEAEAEKERI